MKKKKLWFNLGCCLLLAAGLALLLYPRLSERTVKRAQSRIAAEHTAAVRGTDTGRLDAMWEEAVAYNRTLLELYQSGGARDELLQRYPEMLDVSGDGVMSVLEIPAIDVLLPIRHGEGDSLDRDSVTHLPTSSLPVGGDGTHVLLSGHTGQPGSRVLTDLDRVKPGDVFYLETLGRRLEYRVEETRVVLPEELEQMFTVLPGMDCCTLITCTPYGVNSHRLVVRGVCVEAAEAVGEIGN